jgi:hypothetical protein
LAVEGFLAFAVDALAPYGGTPADEDQARDRFAEVIKPDETAPPISPGAAPSRSSGSSSAPRSRREPYCRSMIFSESRHML